MRVAELQMYRETAFERDGRHSNENARRVYLQRPLSQAEADVADLYTIIIMSFPRRSRTAQSKSYTFGSDDDDDDEERSQASGGQSFVAKPRRQSASSFEFDEEEDSEEERPTSRRPRSCRRDLDISFGSAVSVEPPSSGPSRPRAPPRPVAPPAPRSTPPPADSCPVCKKKTVNQDGSLQVVVQCVACAAKVHFECSGLQNNSRRSGLKYLCPDHDTSRPDVAAKLSQSELRRIAEIMSKRKAGFCVKCRRENARYSVFWPSLRL